MRREPNINVIAPLVIGVIVLVLLAIWAVVRGVHAVVPVVVGIAASQLIIHGVAFVVRRQRRREARTRSRA